MIIQCKNPDLYRAWCAYLGEDNASNRTVAFFRSQAAIPVPLYR